LSINEAKSARSRRHWFVAAGILVRSRTCASAEKAGVKWHFIEDESPTSEEQIPQSLRHF
jgi:hypothetical protein